MRGPPPSVSETARARGEEVPTEYSKDTRSESQRRPNTGAFACLVVALARRI
jgi:hypothetical protein